MQLSQSKRPADRSRVNVEDPNDLRWWCGHLGCSDLKLKEAVRKVGQTPLRVQQYLRNARMPPPH
jgi:hypothetical protein